MEREILLPKREEKLNSAVPQEILPSNGESCESLTVKILHPNIIVHLDSFFDISLVHLIRDLKSPSPWASFAAGNVLDGICISSDIFYPPVDPNNAARSNDSLSHEKNVEST